MPRPARIPPDKAPDVILRAFADRARRRGIRSIVLAEIASDLGISKKTLYQYYSTKEALVEALIDRWVKRLEDTSDPIAKPPRDDLRAAIEHYVDSWARNDAQISDAFWADLESDFPELYERYQETIALREEGMKRIARKLFRRGLDPEYAFALYRKIVALAVDPVFCESVGVTRQESMLTAIEIWANGAFDPNAYEAHKRRAGAKSSTAAGSRRKKKSG